MSNHAPYSPSKLQRYLLCPASYWAEQDYPETEEDRKRSRDGSLLHAAVAADLGTSGTQPDLTDEQEAVVQGCVSYAQRLQLEAPIIEKPVQLAPLDSRLQHVWGTPDLVGIRQSELHIVDWKFGVSEPIQAEGNPQLLCYALGAWKAYYPLRTATIRLHIVQPRLNHLSVAEYTPDMVVNWLHNVLIPMISRIEAKQPTFTPGPIQCQWCKHKGQCQARTQYQIQQMARVVAVREANDSKATDRFISECYAEIKDLSDWLENAKLRAKEILRENQPIAGFKLGAQRRLRTWKDEEKAFLALSKHLEGDQLFDIKLKSPTQISKVLPASLYRELEDQLVETKLSAPIIVRDTQNPLESERISITERFKGLINEKPIN